MKKSNQQGRSMIEILAVLSIMGVLTSSILAGINSLMSQYRHSVIGGQVRDLRKNINNLYAADGQYKGLTNKVLIDQNLVPYSMRKGDSIINAFGGTVSVAPGNTACTNCSFTISFSRIPRRTCLELATLDWKTDSTATLVSVTVNSTKFIWPINKVGAGGVVNESVPNPLPITNAKAISTCTSDDDNRMIWEFQ